MRPRKSERATGAAAAAASAAAPRTLFQLGYCKVFEHIKMKNGKGKLEEVLRLSSKMETFG